MRITDEELQALRILRGRRDHAAFMAGVATLEWQLAVQRAADDPARVGAATWEWRRHLESAERIIADSRDAEVVLGPQILSAHGLDPATAEYQVTADGVVQLLVAGAWREIPDQATTVS